MRRWLNGNQVHRILKDHVGQAEADAFKRQQIPLVRFSFISPWELLWDDPGSAFIYADSGRVRFVAAHDAWMEVPNNAS